MFVDSHCHPFFNKKDLEIMISNFKNSGGKYMISVGTNLDDFHKSLNLAKNYDFIKTTIGIHPSDAKLYSENKEKAIEKLEKLYLENKEFIVGIGECGLDYYRIDKQNFIEEKKLQIYFFKEQINLAKKYNLPVIIHNREAKNDTLQVLKEMNFKNFILHCFSEDLEFANEVLDFSPNCKISFSGILTFNSAKNIQETAKNIPLKNILIETDCPYLTPVPYRGKEENEPAYTKYVLEKIFELRNEEKDEIERLIFENSLDIFRIKKEGF